MSLIIGLLVAGVALAGDVEDAEAESESAVEEAAAPSEGEATDAAPAEGEAVEGEAADGEAADGEAVEGEAVEGEAEDAVEAEPAFVPRWNGQVGPDDPYYELELMYAEGRNDEGVARAKELMAASPNDPALYWHINRFMFEQGEQFQRTDAGMNKLAHYETMVEYAEKGLALDSDDPHLLFALGIAKGRLGTTRGVLSSLFMAKDIEQAWLQSASSGYHYASINGAEHLPCDTYLGLSIYYRLVPDWWVIQMIAGTRGDQDKSLEYAVKADACAPNRIRNLKELGVSQICYGQKRKQPDLVETGKGTLGRIAGLAAETATDPIDQKHAAMIVADPNMACEYSRDGQQDLDEKKLKK